MADATENLSPDFVESSISKSKLSEMVGHIINISVLEEEASGEVPTKCSSIYRAPENLRKLKKEAFTPECISIGPIHYGKKELMPMQEHKLRYFHFFWDRVSNEQAIRTYKHYIETKEEDIRQCYAEKFPDITKGKLVDMMLLDAVFIMELFLRICHFKSDIFKGLDLSHSDDVIMDSWLSEKITRDLILLENQIPFSVLCKLYDDVVPLSKKKIDHYIVPSHNKKEELALISFVDLATFYFAKFYDTPSSDTFLKSKEKKRGFLELTQNPYHLTDLIRHLYLPRARQYISHADHVLRTATKLHESGVSFEKGDVKKRLLEISFDQTPILSLFLCFGFLKPFKACLRIPLLKVNHTMESLFMNLIALEQCHYREYPYFCNYMSFLDQLIHTQLDVELLVENEVIVHELGSHKEVASLVNGLGKYVATNSTCYYMTINKLNQHYKSNWNHTMATLRFVYFKDLWRASSTVVGIFVLLFAVFQFIVAVRDVF